MGSGKNVEHLWLARVSRKKVRRLFPGQGCHHFKINWCSYFHPESFLIKIICARNDFIVCHFFFNELNSLKRVRRNSLSEASLLFRSKPPCQSHTPPPIFSLLMYQGRQQTSSFKESFLIEFPPFQEDEANPHHPRDEDIPKKSFT